MKVAPLEREGVTTDEIRTQQQNVFRNGTGVEKPLAGPLFNALGAGTRETQLPRRVLRHGTVLPDDLQLVRRQNVDLLGIHGPQHPITHAIRKTALARKAPVFEKSTMLLGSIVLAGGRSRRMGRPKEALPFAESTLLGHTVDTLLTCAYPVVIVARGPDHALPPLALEAETVFDETLDQGPLMGMQTGMRALSDRCDLVYITGCDAPFLTRGAVDWLANQLGEHDLVMSRVDERLQPLGAVYRTSLLPLVETMLSEGIQTPRTLAERCNSRILTTDDLDSGPGREFLVGLNTPEEYQAALDRSHGKAKS